MVKEIELDPDKVSEHVKRFKELADQGKYDNVVFHRHRWVHGSTDVKFGNSEL